MDVLSDVLRVIRLSGAVFFTAEFSSPWAIVSPSSPNLAHVINPSAECFSIFHVLIEGGCWVQAKGEPAFEMHPGDVLVAPQGNEHIMASDLALQPIQLKKVVPNIPTSVMPTVLHGGGGAVTRFMCGYLHCDQRFNPLFATLPKLLCVRTRAGDVVVEPSGLAAQAPMPFHQGMWLNTTLYYLMQESQAKRPGSESLLARLSETMFVEVLRDYMQKLPPDQKGWLAGLNDPQVGRALALLHSQPARPWTVEDLARQAGVSRSALADRFTKLIGESPMSYLASWRMHLARQLLSEGHLSAGEVATRVGYDSEYAFNRAFKRHVGQPPATWRKKTHASTQ